jgi:hypothetical protein
MRVGGTRCMSLRDGAMRRDTFEIHAALLAGWEERADGEPFPIAARERKGDRPPFMLLGLHGLVVSPRDSAQCRLGLTRRRCRGRKLPA